MTDEVVYWLWLYSVLGPCNGKFAGMLEDYGSASDIYGMKNSGDFLRRLSPKEIAGLGGAKLEGAEKMAERCGKAGVEIVCFGGARYPARLAKTRVPPMLLFVTGDTAALEPVFSVAGVGARSGTEYGRRAVRKICVPLARAGVTLVSGLACGIDGEVHRAALECGGQTIAVMGNPIDSTYPAVHRELRREIERAGGVVVSEYPPGTEIYRAMFSQRNRIISGLAQVVVIFEAAQKSGTMITAAWALDDGREVFAVPGSILSAYSEGTNSLIKQGAAPALSAGDILEALELPGKPDEPGEAAAPAPELTEPQRRIYAALEGGEMTLDELSAGTGMEPFVVLAELTGLEIEGAVVSKGGTRYARKA